jgi:hypothetical protein
MFSRLVGLALFLAIAVPAEAFLTIGESGELTPVGTYKIGVEPQIRISNGSGANIGAMIDTGINDEWSWRVQLGTGETDFWTGASAKWVPIPDYENQPAIGLRVDANFGRDADETFTVFRGAPLVSKSFDTEVGKLTPYAALPIGVWSMKGESDNISQFVIGSEGKFEQAPDWMFSAELGFNMSKAFSYISGTATFFFNDTKPR